MDRSILGTVLLQLPHEEESGSLGIIDCVVGPVSLPFRNLLANREKGDATRGLFGFPG